MLPWTHAICSTQWEQQVKPMSWVPGPAVPTRPFKKESFSSSYALTASSVEQHQDSAAGILRMETHPSSPTQCLCQQRGSGSSQWMSPVQLSTVPCLLPGSTFLQSWGSLLMPMAACSRDVPHHQLRNQSTIGSLDSESCLQILWHSQT